MFSFLMGFVAGFLAYRQAKGDLKQSIIYISFYFAGLIVGTIC